MHTAMSRSVDEDRKAGHWADRAEAAGEFRARRESVPTTLRRIESLEADRRPGSGPWTASPTGGRCGTATQDAYMPAEGKYLERVKVELEQIDEQLAYWRAHVAKMEAEQGVKVWGPDDFTRATSPSSCTASTRCCGSTRSR